MEMNALSFEPGPITNIPHPWTTPGPRHDLSNTVLGDDRVQRLDPGHLFPSLQQRSNKDPTKVPGATHAPHGPGNHLSQYDSASWTRLRGTGGSWTRAGSSNVGGMAKTAVSMIQGPPGVGKSTFASAYAAASRSVYPSLIWKVSASSHATLLRDLASLTVALGDPDPLLDINQADEDEQSPAPPGPPAVPAPPGSSDGRSRRDVNGFGVDSRISANMASIVAAKEGQSGKMPRWALNTIAKVACQRGFLLIVDDVPELGESPSKMPWLQAILVSLDAASSPTYPGFGAGPSKPIHVPDGTSPENAVRAASWASLKMDAAGGFSGARPSAPRHVLLVCSFPVPSYVLAGNRARVHTLYPLPSGAGVMLLNSVKRSVSHPPRARPHLENKVLTLGNEDCYDMLDRFMAPSALNLAEEIVVGRFGGNAAAIVQAGASMARTEVDFGTWLQLYKTPVALAKLLTQPSHGALGLDRAPMLPSLVDRILRTLAAKPVTGRTAEILIETMACLDHDHPIPVQVFSWLNVGWARVCASLEFLHSLGYLIVKPGDERPGWMSQPAVDAGDEDEGAWQGSVRINPAIGAALLQHVVSCARAGMVRAVEWMISLIRRAWRFSYSAPETWEESRVLAPHLRAVVGLADELGVRPAIVAFLMNLSGLAGFEMGVTGNYLDALRYSQRSLELKMEEHGEMHKETATCLANLASVYRKRGEYARALETMHRATRIFTVVCGKEDATYAMSLSNTAGLHELLGEHEEAYALFEESLSLTKKLVGKEHRDYAIGLNNLAGLLENMGRMKESNALYEESLEIKTRLLGESHPETSTCVSNLAGVKESMGEYAESLRLYERARDIDVACYGEHHVSVSSSMQNLAYLYKALARYDEADELYQRAISIRRSMLGEAHPLFATTLNNLAMLRESQGRYEEALEMCHSAKRLSNACLGDQHPRYASACSSLAHVLTSIDRPDEALPLYRTALEIRRRVFGDSHAMLGVTLVNLVHALLDVGSQEALKEAYELAPKALVMLQKVEFGHRHPRTVAGYSLFARASRMNGSNVRAKAALDLGWAIRSRWYDVKHPQNAKMMYEQALIIADLVVTRGEKRVPAVLASELGGWELGEELENIPEGWPEDTVYVSAEEAKSTALGLLQEALSIYEGLVVEGHRDQRLVLDAIKMFTE